MLMTRYRKQNLVDCWHEKSYYSPCVLSSVKSTTY